MLEYLKISTGIIFLFLVYSFTANDDYHKKFDKTTIIHYNCRDLIGSWHPDVPQEVLDKCRAGQEQSVRIKVYQ